MTALDWHLHRFLGICADWCLSGLNLIETKTKKKAMQKLKNKKKKTSWISGEMKWIHN